MNRLLVTLTATLAVLTACSLPSDGEGDGSGVGNDVEQYSTTFDRIGPRGYIDMSLEFANPTDQPVILKGRLVARDAAGPSFPTSASPRRSGRHWRERS